MSDTVKTIRVSSDEDLYTQRAKEKGITRSEAKAQILVERVERLNDIDGMHAQTAFAFKKKKIHNTKSRYTNMTDKQIVNELKKQDKKDPWACVLLIMMQSKMVYGLMGGIRGRL